MTLATERLEAGAALRGGRRTDAAEPITAARVITAP